MQSAALTGRTILVVEDEPLIALDIASAFEKSGAVVVKARSLAQARGFVERKDLSAAVVDFGLSDGDAASMCTRLASRDIPYVLHSGYSGKRITRGRGAVIPKPANPTALIEAIVELLGGQNDASLSAHRTSRVLQP
jgi:DNA-binding response OmpR family regulator